MSLLFYKVIHLTALFMIFIYLGAAIVQAGDSDSPWRKTMSILHGVGLLLLVVTGFGMLARLEIVSFPWPGWVFAKFAIWLAIGAAPTLINKIAQRARVWLVLALVLGLAAAYLALYKPF